MLTMPYDPANADMIRADLGLRDGLSEKRMFGGVCFLLHGHMVCGTSRDHALYRVGKDNEAAALARDGVEPMIHGGRRMGGFVRVEGDVFHDPATRAALTAMALQFTGALPPKPEDE